MSFRAWLPGLVCAIPVLASIPRVETAALWAPGPVYEVLAADVDGNGSVDLVVAHGDTTGGQGKGISVFFGTDGKFGNTPAVTIWTDAAVYDLAHAAGGFRKLVLLDDEKLRLVDWKNGSASGQTIPLDLHPLLPSNADRPVHWPLAVDADGDGRDELAIPDARGVSLFRVDSTRVILLQKLRTESVSLTVWKNPLRWTAETPALCALDFNGDGAPDLLSTLGDRLDVFLARGKPNGGESPRLPDLRFRMACRGLDSPILRLDPEETRLEIRDLDRDGFADLIVSRRSRLDFTNRMSAVQIHFNKLGRIDPVPDQVIPMENLGASFALGDWNGDGRIDLALPRLTVGIEQAARVLLTRRAKAAFDLYCLRDDGRYPGKPDAVLPVSATPDIEDWMREGFAHAESTDWNGDGKPDLLIEIGKSKRIVFLQREGFKFEPDPLDLPPAGNSALLKLYGGGSAGLALWDDGSREIRIVRSTGR